MNHALFGLFWGLALGLYVGRAVGLDIGRKQAALLEKELDPDRFDRATKAYFHPPNYDQKWSMLRSAIKAYLA